MKLKIESAGRRDVRRSEWGLLRIGRLAVCQLGVICMTALPAWASPNIVLLLTDDQAPSLAETMPAVQALAARGATLTHAYYNDPLCEPSRATILTGQYAQNTGVATNSWADFAASGVDQH